MSFYRIILHRPCLGLLICRFHRFQIATCHWMSLLEMPRTDLISWEVMFVKFQYLDSPWAVICSNLLMTLLAFLPCCAPCMRLSITLTSNPDESLPSPCCNLCQVEQHEYAHVSGKLQKNLGLLHLVYQTFLSYIYSDKGKKDERKASKLHKDDIDRSEVKMMPMCNLASWLCCVKAKNDSIFIGRLTKTSGWQIQHNVCAAQLIQSIILGMSLETERG